MGSLAVLVIFIMLSLWGLAGISVLLSFLGFRLVGALLGAVSLAAGVWLLCVLPHSPFLGAINILAGAVAIGRKIKEKK